jgi:hypothetical protein
MRALSGTTPLELQPMAADLGAATAARTHGCARTMTQRQDDEPSIAQSR